MVDLSTLGVLSCLPIALIFSIIGLLHARVIFKDDSIVFYLTAKNSVGVRELALSFFASLSGAWMLFVPSQIVVDAEKGSGWSGLLVCCVFSVLSFILIVWFGNLIRERFPEVLSIGHYAGLRFGYTAQIFITCVSFGNMVLAMAAEYTALGRLFSLVLDVHPIFPVLMVGTVTSLYTAAGGVYVTIRTHQYHAYFSLTLLLIVLVYIGFTFDANRLGPVPTPLQENKNRTTSIFTFAIPIFTMYIFGDDVWTRVWAAKDKDTLYKGGILGGLLLTVVVFVFGFCSYLAAWAGYDGPSRMAFFAILDGANGTPYWILIVVSMFGITVSQSNIDSLQNGIVVCIISLAMSFGMRLSLNWTRVVVLLINIPIIYIGIQGLNILSMILFSNMMTSFCAAPIILSIFPRFNQYLHQVSLIFSYAFGLIALLLYGFLRTGFVFYGLYTFVYLNYDSGAFAVAFIAPIVGLLIWNILERFLLSTNFGKHKFAQISQSDQLFSDLEMR